MNPAILGFVVIRSENDWVVMVLGCTRSFASSWCSLISFVVGELTVWDGSIGQKANAHDVRSVV